MNLNSIGEEVIKSKFIHKKGGMMKAFINIFLLSIPIFGTVIFAQEKSKNDINFSPVKHATFVIQTSSTTIYVDPVGDTTAFQ